MGAGSAETIGVLPRVSYQLYMLLCQSLSHPNPRIIESSSELYPLPCGFRILQVMLCINLPQSVSLSSFLSGSLEILIKNIDSRPHPRPTESQSLGLNPGNLHFRQHPNWIYTD